VQPDPCRTVPSLEPLSGSPTLEARNTVPYCRESELPEEIAVRINDHIKAAPL
jgi:hypothetical protein